MPADLLSGRNHYLVCRAILCSGRLPSNAGSKRRATPVQRQLEKVRSNQNDSAEGTSKNGNDADAGGKTPLSSSLMQGNAYLNEVARGRALLAKGTKAVTPVKLVQMALITAVPQISLGKTGVSGIDGDFGQLTEDAVMQFQADRGLDQDRLVGPMTLEAFLNDLWMHTGREKKRSVRMSQIVETNVRQTRLLNN